MKTIGTAMQVLLATILVLYACDWAQLHYRAAHGGGYRTMQVEQYLATPLKGNKAEYDYMGTQPESCASSLFPQSGDAPCWWLKRHLQHWE